MAIPLKIMKNIVKLSRKHKFHYGLTKIGFVEGAKAMYAELAPELERLKSLLAEAEEALEFAIEKHNQHVGAYDEDIFPDDGRKPCQTTSGRMGRHMVKVYETYLLPARETLAKIRGGG